MGRVSDIWITIAAAAFLLLMALPLARIRAEPGVRRRFQAFPPIWAVITASLAAYVTAVIALAVLAPAVLRAGALVAAAVFLWLLWQSRLSFGITRGLPLGSLAFLPIAPWRNPDYYRMARAQHGPVFKFRHLHEPAVAIVGLGHISDFLKANENDLLIPSAPFNVLIPGGFVRYMSGTQHKNTAGVLRSAFTQGVVEACEADFAAESGRTLASLETEQADLAPAIERLVTNEMMLCFLGVRPGGQLDELERLFEIADYRHLARVGETRAKAAILDIVREMRLLASASDDTRNGQRSFLSELAMAHPSGIASDEVMGNFAYALHTGRLDVSGLLTWLIALLGENPSWVARLRAGIDANECDVVKPGGLADRMVRETLRLRQSEFLLRRAKRPIEWNGFKIPAGWHIRLCVSESHRSPDAHEFPDLFDPDRFIQPAPDRTRYSPFGFAPHICPGEHLARALGRHLAAEVARAYEITACDIEPWEFSGFHWRPNPKMRVGLARLA